MYIACMLLLNSFSFCMSDKVFTSPTFLKYNFTGYRIWGQQVLFFSPNTLKILIHHLLICVVSHKKCAINSYFYSSIHKITFSSHCFWDFLSLSLVWSNLIITCFGIVSSCLLCLEFTEIFESVGLVFIISRIFLAFISSNMFSVPYNFQGLLLHIY